jgi:hypothetical protein
VTPDYLTQILSNPSVLSVMDYLWKIFVFFIPIILGMMAWRLWVHYVQRLYISSLKWSTLQVKIPKDVFKTPQAMEIFITNALYQTFGTNTWVKKYWEGRVRTWFSLEIVSIEGKVYFFIRTLSWLRNLIESQIYAQYPKAEITEVPDYTEDVAERLETEDWDMFGLEFKLTKDDVYPIKTYIDYGLDKSSSQEEEQKIDPITPMLEYMGSIGPGEQVWFQILVRGAADRFPKPGTWSETQSWAKATEDEIKKITEKYATVNDKGKKTNDPSKIPKGEQDKIAALVRSMDKYGFDCGIRGMYLAKKSNFNGVHNIGLMSSVKQYNSQNLNGFKPNNVTSFDYPWQDYKNRRVNLLKKEMLDAYRSRSFFYMPHASKYVARKMIKRTPIILNSEELATIYHFPGAVSETPTFKRIESKKSEPPANLPM